MDGTLLEYYSKCYPDNPGLSLGLLGQGILPFLVLPDRVGWSSYCVLPSGKVAGGRPQLAGKPIV